MPGENITTHIAREIAISVGPLTHDTASIAALGKITVDKGDGHTAHEIDQLAERILFQVLERVGYRGIVYSEESGLVKLGGEDRFIICDPYCNTTLTFRGIRESAVAVYEYNTAGEFVAGAIADIQIPRVIWAGQSGGAYTTGFGDDDTARAVQCSTVSRVDEAFLVVSLLKAKRRAMLPERLLRDAAMLTTIDGAIVAARIAVGEIDGFVDATVGQPAYEALAYQLVRAAGGVVTDEQGRNIDFGAIVRELAEGRVGRYRIVAAASPVLHRDILDQLT